LTIDPPDKQSEANPVAEVCGRETGDPSQNGEIVLSGVKAFLTTDYE